MNLSIQADYPPLRQGNDGVVRVGDTRIPLERVLHAFINGMTAEQIAHDFDVLKVEDVYAVVNYYLHHREEVNAYLAAADRESLTARNDAEKQFPAVGIRARLLARRPPEAKS
jgi:uncharacterized protein (DUF433 family)